MYFQNRERTKSRRDGNIAQRKESTECVNLEPQSSRPVTQPSSILAGCGSVHHCAERGKPVTYAAFSNV